MRVQVKLMASLRSKLPPGSQGGVTSLELEPGATISAALERLSVTRGQIHLVLVNGAMELDRSRALNAGDELVVFPPVAGG
jgi:molybdopterin converting factor small subunit